MLKVKLSRNLFTTIMTLFTPLLFLSCGNAQQSASGIIQNVSPAVFEKAIGNENVILLDVRTEKEVNEAHIIGSTNIDFFSANFDQSISKLNKEKEVYVYCRSGGRSYKTAVKLEALGFKKIYNLDGGIGAWQNAGKEVATNE